MATTISGRYDIRTVMWAHELRSSQLSFLTRLGTASAGQWGARENRLTGLGVAVVVVVEEDPAGDRPPPPLGICGGAGAGNLCLDRGTGCCTVTPCTFDRPLPDVVPGNIRVAVKITCGKITLGSFSPTSFPVNVHIDLWHVRLKCVYASFKKIEQRFQIRKSVFFFLITYFKTPFPTEHDTNSRHLLKTNALRLKLITIKTQTLKSEMLFVCCLGECCNICWHIYIY